MKIILVTGGAGYIGSHACVELLEAGYDVVVVDNLSNSSEESLRRVREITGREPVFIKGDIRDREALDAIFTRYPVDAVIHFAIRETPPTLDADDSAVWQKLCRPRLANCRILVVGFVLPHDGL